MGSIFRIFFRNFNETFTKLFKNQKDVLYSFDSFIDNLIIN